ncbi:hypothetical protein Y1Q_0018707 [Alligator mississippiensis]|uniref:Uncharacterized protein n=1 Tax=Alligator mississippiensis TaxID=8496 RepID=A0A151NSC7_ALLMI|nr:hypothetical protein Y1Q_0018707 [Alligator mississippiensis]
MKVLGLAQDLPKPRLEKSTYRRDGNSVRSLPSFFSSRPRTHQTFPSKGTAFSRVTRRLLARTTGNRHRQGN